MKKKKNTFLNKYIHITLKLNMSRNEYKEGQEFVINKPIAVAGYLLSEDDRYMYIGDTEDEITMRIPHENTVYIETMPDVDELDEEMDKSTPSNFNN